MHDINLSKSRSAVQNLIYLRLRFFWLCNSCYFVLEFIWHLWNLSHLLICDIDIFMFMLYLLVHFTLIVHIHIEYYVGYGSQCCSKKEFGYVVEVLFYTICICIYQKLRVFYFMLGFILNGRSLHSNVSLNSPFSMGARLNHLNHHIYIQLNFLKKRKKWQNWHLVL